MFSVFKKKPKDGQSSSLPPGVELLDGNLQKKFARGVHYNMKIIIKGDRNVGKSCLFARLQGQPFKDEYVPTEEIQCTTIQWSYRVTDDVVKVEVWDVVDKSRIKRKKQDGLKFDHGNLEFEDATLDAAFINVYKDCHGVILMYDITKAWTWDYIEREMAVIPTHLPVIVIGNRRDMGHHRQVSIEKAQSFVDNYDRGEDSAPSRYSEMSTRNNFGLRFLHLFFNIPFLTLQRESLLRQLQRNSDEILLAAEELDLFQDSEEASYDGYSDRVNAKRRAEADSQGVQGARPTPPQKAAADAKKPEVSTPSEQKPATPQRNVPVDLPVASTIKSPVKKSNNGTFSPARFPQNRRSSKSTPQHVTAANGTADQFLADENDAFYDAAPMHFDSPNQATVSNNDGYHSNSDSDHENTNGIVIATFEDVDSDLEGENPPTPSPVAPLRITSPASSTSGKPLNVFDMDQRTSIEDHVSVLSSPGSSIVASTTAFLPAEIRNSKHSSVSDSVMTSQRNSNSTEDSPFSAADIDACFGVKMTAEKTRKKPTKPDYVGDGENLNPLVSPKIDDFGAETYLTPRSQRSEISPDRSSAGDTPRKSKSSSKKPKKSKSADEKSEKKKKKRPKDLRPTTSTKELDDFLGVEPVAIEAGNYEEL